MSATQKPHQGVSSLWVSRNGSASDWCALQEALYKCIDTIQYNRETKLFNQRYICKIKSSIATGFPALFGTMRVRIRRDIKSKRQHARCYAVPNGDGGGRV